MFEKASRLKLRFASPAGPLTAEDLWDLPLLARNNRSMKPNLDDMAKALHAELKAGTTESFVLKEERPNVELELKFEIVKRVIEVKLADQKAAEEKAAATEIKQRVMAIIAKKKDEELEGKSLEELQELLGKL